MFNGHTLCFFDSDVAYHHGHHVWQNITFCSDISFYIFMVVAYQIVAFFFEGGRGLHHLMIKCTDVWGHVRSLGIFVPNMSDSSPELWNEGILWYRLICHLFWNPHISPLTWLWLGDPSILNMFDYGQPPPTTCTCEPWHASYAITCMSWLTPLLLHLW